MLMSEEMCHGTFEYLRWFPEGNRAHLLKPKNESENKTKTIGEFYRDWIELMKERQSEWAGRVDLNHGGKKTRKPKRS